MSAEEVGTLDDVGALGYELRHGKTMISPLLVADRIERVDLGCASGREKSREEAYSARKERDEEEERKRKGEEADCLPAKLARSDRKKPVEYLSDAAADKDTDDAAEEPHDECLGDEEDDDILRRCADRTHDSDLSSALEQGDGHRAEQKKGGLAHIFLIDTCSDTKDPRLDV